MLLLVCKKLNVLHSIKSFCPKRFDSFAFSPSLGASGGILVVWNSSIFDGTLLQVQQFAVVIEFVSRQNNERWTLVVVYGPCQGEARDNFVNWLYHLNIPVDENWLFWGTLTSCIIWITETCLVGT